MTNKKGGKTGKVDNMQTSRPKQLNFRRKHWRISERKPHQRENPLKENSFPLNKRQRLRQPSISTLSNNSPSQLYLLIRDTSLIILLDCKKEKNNFS